jgi:hypothetical protein
MSLLVYIAPTSELHNKECRTNFKISAFHLNFSYLHVPYKEVYDFEDHRYGQTKGKEKLGFLTY